MQVGLHMIARRPRACCPTSMARWRAQRELFPFSEILQGDAGFSDLSDVSRGQRTGLSPSMGR